MEIERSKTKELVTFDGFRDPDFFLAYDLLFLDMYRHDVPETETYAFEMLVNEILRTTDLFGVGVVNVIQIRTWRLQEKPAWE